MTNEKLLWPPVLAVLGFVICGSAAAQTWSDYIDACKVAVGNVVIPQKLQCLDGATLPIKYKGVAIPAKTAADSAKFTDTTTCDEPPILPDVAGGGIGQCVPNSTFQSSFDTDGKGYVLLCRNYEYRSSDAQALDPIYDDLAMIVYNKDTGGSCFFQQLAKPIARLPEVEVGTKFQAGIAGKDVPSPFASDADKFWLAPNKIKGLGCANCHDANPFIRTPYIQQVRDAAALPSHGKSRDYYFASSEFQDAWQKWHAYFDLKPTGKGEIGRCVLCHRVGISFGSDELTKFSTARQKTPNQTDGLTFEQTHWMPPKAKPDTFDADFKASIDKLLACNAAPLGTNCNKVELPKRP